jgi:hypothetical protein
MILDVGALVEFEFELGDTLRPLRIEIAPCLKIEIVANIKIVITKNPNI